MDTFEKSFLLTFLSTLCNFFLFSGIDSGMNLKVAGKGNSGSNGAPPGDVYVQVCEFDFASRLGSVHCPSFFMKIIL